VRVASPSGAGLPNGAAPVSSGGLRLMSGERLFSTARSRFGSEADESADERRDVLLAACRCRGPRAAGRQRCRRDQRPGRHVVGALLVVAAPSGRRSTTSACAVSPRGAARSRRGAGCLPGSGSTGPDASAPSRPRRPGESGAHVWPPQPPSVANWAPIQPMNTGTSSGQNGRRSSRNSSSCCELPLVAVVAGDVDVEAGQPRSTSRVASGRRGSGSGRRRGSPGSGRSRGAPRRARRACRTPRRRGGRTRRRSRVVDGGVLPGVDEV
jgi:hypothetical protein